MKATTLKRFISKSYGRLFERGDVYEGEEWQVMALEAQGLVSPIREERPRAAKAAAARRTGEEDQKPKTPRGRKTTATRAKRETPAKGTAAKRKPGGPRKAEAQEEGAQP